MNTSMASSYKSTFKLDFSTKSSSTNKQQEINDIVHSAVHDIRSPLLIFKSFSQIISRHSDENKKQEAIKRMGEAVGQMEKSLSVLVQLVDLNTIDSEQKILFFQDVFREIKLSLLDKIAEVTPEILIDFEKAEKIKMCKQQLYLLLFHLMSNALAFRKKEEQLVINIETVSTTKDIIFTIQDNGKGIALEQYATDIFTPFHRLEGDGLGVGLSIVKGIVEQNKGSILIESTPSIGTKVSISLPQI